MPVTFNTPNSHRVTMLDKDADFMLKAMQTSGNIPGALFAEAIPDALKVLQDRIDLESDNDDAAQTEDNNHVGFHTKALPLMELLQIAIEQNETLMWDRG